MLKRLSDIIFSLLGLAFLWPLFLVIGFLIKWDSQGPVFYRGRRVGQDGKIFRIYKFRTMALNAERLGGPSTSQDDPRITRLGKLLRKYKLDELPQLINVLKGEMSFVGPRPEVPNEVATYSKKEKQVLTVAQGITDYASLHFPNEGEILKGAKDPHRAYQTKIKPEKLRLQLKYVKKHNLWLDFKIILKTLKAIIKH